MTQQQAIQLFLPILIILPVLYFRMRRMSRAQPLKLGRMWIRPALFLGLMTVALLAPGPQGQPHDWAPDAWTWLTLAGALGGWTEEARASQWCDKQVSFDPDLWIVEIEDREGRAFVDEPII